ncbi:MAG: hypothetical protein U5R06_21695 [candidate division KSB1 bacterium]|nr:hypothetical protein [candidate division KSB1 bacterium]
MATSVVPVMDKTVPESSRDPLRIMIEIAESDTLSDADKTNLIEYSKQRFKNRRRMAYLALMTLLASLVLVFMAAFIDGLTGSDILTCFKENASLFIWLEGFLTVIVAAYFGVSAWRPSS